MDRHCADDLLTWLWTAFASADYKTVWDCGVLLDLTNPTQKKLGTFRWFQISIYGDYIQIIIAGMKTDIELV